MKIYNIPQITQILLFIFYQYLYIPDITFVISYCTHYISRYNFIRFTSGIYCIHYIDQIIVTLKNNHLIHYNYFFYGLAMIILYCSILEIFIQTIISGINTIIEIIKVLSNKIIFRTVHIELQNTLEDNLNQIGDHVNEANGVNGANEENRTNQSYEDFVDELNIRYPLRCRGLQNNDNDRLDVEQCNICLEELNFDQLYRTFGCSHSFHPQCIDRWLFQSRYCPICRTHVNIQ